MLTQIGYRSLVAVDYDTKECVFQKMNGEQFKKTVNITKDQIDNWINGELIQSALPDTTKEEREWFITGMEQEDWDAMWSED